MSEEKITVDFKLEKETKNTFRYTEKDNDEGLPPMVGSLYLQKFATKKLGNPKEIRVTIEKREEQ